MNSESSLLRRTYSKSVTAIEATEKLFSSLPAFTEALSGDFLINFNPVSGMVVFRRRDSLGNSSIYKVCLFENESGHLRNEYQMLVSIQQRATSVSTVLTSVVSTPDMFKKMYIDRHCHIAKALELAEAVHDFLDERPRITLKLEDIEGKSLRSCFLEHKRRPTLALSQFLSIAYQLSLAIDLIHDSSIIHRDINPDNIIVRELPDNEYFVLVIDLNTAVYAEKCSYILPSYKIQGYFDRCLDVSDLKLGRTLPYISPEQTGRINKAIDYRSDFYSLGMTLFELLSGTLPFQAQDLMGWIHCHIAQKCPRLHSVVPDVPLVISRMISKLVEKSPDDRYQSARGLKHDLLQMLNCIQEYMRKTHHPAIKPHDQEQDKTDFSVIFSLSDVEVMNALRSMEGASLGSNDHSNRTLLVCDRLYGREKELKELEYAFNSTLLFAHLEFVVVTGAGGSGKSRLIQEIRPLVVEHRGFFVVGKFDQFSQATPYYAFVQGFRKLFTNLINGQEGGLDRIRSKFSTEMDPTSFQLLKNVMPSIELLVDPESPIASQFVPMNNVSSQEITHLFRTAWINVIRILSTESPLVIFFDDIQWSDTATMNLMKEIIQHADGVRLLFVVSYRAGEISPAHPIFDILLDSKKNGAVRELDIMPLKERQVSELLSHTLGTRQQELTELAKVVFEVTDGNPFNIHTYLKELFLKKMLWIEESVNDDETTRWKWSLEKIMCANLGGEPAIDLMTSQLRELLPVNTLDTLKYAACIGYLFDLDTLCHICKKSVVQVAVDLWPAVENGYLITEGDEHRLLKQVVENLGAEKVVFEKPVMMKFIHDKVQRASYGLTDDETAASINLDIARYMLSKGFEEAEIFSVLNHYNVGSTRLKPDADRPEIHKLACMNHAAAIKAHGASAFLLARKFNKQALDNLVSLSPEEQWWTEDYDLIFGITHSEGLAALALVDHVAVRAAAAKIRARGKTPHEKLALNDAEIDLFYAELNYEQTIQNCIADLKSLGYEMTPQRLVEMDEWYRLNPPEVVLGMLDSWKDGSKPYMTDPRALKIVQTLSLSMSCYYLTKQLETISWVVFEMLTTVLSMQKYHAHLLRGLLYYSFRKISILDTDAKLHFFELWENLHKTYTVSTLEERVRVNFLHTVICPANMSPVAMEQTMNEAVSRAAELMNFNLLNFSSFVRLYVMLEFGFPMADLVYWGKRYAGLMSRLPGPMYDLLLKANKFYVSMTVDTRETKEPFVVPSFDVGSSRPHQNQIFCMTGVVAANLFGDLTSLDFFLEVALGFNKGLEHLYAIYRIMSEVMHVEDTDIDAKVKRIDSYLAQSLSVTRICEARELYKYYLGCAEKAQLLKQDAEAITNYERAIESAEFHKCRSFLAFANERLALFLISRGPHFRRYARIAMMAAVETYHEWGVLAKVQQIEIRHGDLLRECDKERVSSALPRDTSTQSTNMTRTGTPSTLDNSRTGSMLAASSTMQQIRMVTTSPTGSGGDAPSVTNPDFSTIVKATNAISNEQKLETLLRQLIFHTAVNAGADYGLLLLKDATGRLFIQASFRGIEEIKVLQALPIDHVNGHLLPLSIIEEVERTNKAVILIDAAESELFSGDQYVLKNKCMSIMCSPIIQKKKLLGIVYLENTLSAGVFTEERLEVVKALATAAGISIENAHLQQVNFELQTALNNSPPPGSESRPVYNVDAPIQKTIASIRVIMESFPELRFELAKVLKVITSGNAFASDIDDVHDEFGQELDSDTKDWIKVSMLQDGKSPRSTPVQAIISSLPSKPQMPLKNAMYNRLVAVPGVQQCLNAFDSFHFNIFDLVACSRGPCISILACYIMEKLNLCKNLNLRPDKVWNYFRTIEKAYPTNPYHGHVHGADVMQTALLLLRDSHMNESLSDLELLAVIISGAGHDVDHLGVNNNYLVQTRDPLAILYSDQSVLEFHHCAKTFELARGESDIFDGLCPLQFKEIRKMIVGMILATDMSKHFEYINKFKTRLASFETAGAIKPGDGQDRSLFLEVAIKCADLNNPTKPTNQAVRWTDAIMQEFYHQGDLEKQRGLPVSKFMDRNDPNVPKCQIGFIDVIVSPIFDLWRTAGGDTVLNLEYAQNIAANRKFWETRLNASQLHSEDAVESFYPDLKSLKQVHYLADIEPDKEEQATASQSRHTASDTKEKKIAI